MEIATLRKVRLCLLKDYSANVVQVYSCLWLLFLIIIPNSPGGSVEKVKIDGNKVQNDEGAIEVEEVERAERN